MTLCDMEQRVWEDIKKNTRQSFLNYDVKKKRWQLPVGSIMEQYD